MRVIVVLMMSLCLFACRQTTKVRIAPKETDTLGNMPMAEQTCYAYIKGKDTATLTLITTGNVSTGDLDYKWFEKDRNSGTIQGEMHGDTLIATYTFNAEGRQSVRQIAFLKKGAQFLEGVAPVQEKNGQMVFSDLSKLDFKQAIVFDKVACK